MKSWQGIRKIIYDWLDENSDQLGVLLWNVDTDTLPGYDTSRPRHKYGKDVQELRPQDLIKLTDRILNTIQSNFLVQPVKHLGSGDLGAAFLVKSKYGEAVLKLSMDEKEAQVAGCLLNSEGHPNVIKIYDVVKINKVGLYVLLEEYGGEPLTNDDPLKDVIDGLKDNEYGALDIDSIKDSSVPGMQEIYSAYLWLNKTCDFTWEDLHSGNIVKRGSTYKIIDIGNTKPGSGTYQELSLLESILDNIILIKQVNLL